MMSYGRHRQMPYAEVPGIRNNFSRDNFHILVIPLHNDLLAWINISRHLISVKFTQILVRMLALTLNHEQVSPP